MAIHLSRLPEEEEEERPVLPYVGGMTLSWRSPAPKVCPRRRWTMSDEEGGEEEEEEEEQKVTHEQVFGQRVGLKF